MDKAKETDRMRDVRIAETNNGSTLRTRVVPNKKGYTRCQKHMKKDEE